MPGKKNLILLQHVLNYDLVQIKSFAQTFTLRPGLCCELSIQLYLAFCQQRACWESIAFPGENTLLLQELTPVFPSKTCTEKTIFLAKIAVPAEDMSQKSLQICNSLLHSLTYLSEKNISISPSKQLLITNSVRDVCLLSPISNHLQGAKYKTFPLLSGPGLTKLLRRQRKTEARILKFLTGLTIAFSFSHGCSLNCVACKSQNRGFAVSLARQELSTHLLSEGWSFGNYSKKQRLVV